MEEPEPGVQRGVRLRDQTHRTVHPEPVHHGLRQGLRQKQRLPGRPDTGRHRVEGPTFEALAGHDPVPGPQARTVAQPHRRRSRLNLT